MMEQAVLEAQGCSEALAVKRAGSGVEVMGLRHAEVMALRLWRGNGI